jgi:hypothetical protein
MAGIKVGISSTFPLPPPCSLPSLIVPMSSVKLLSISFPPLLSPVSEKPRETSVKSSNVKSKIKSALAVLAARRSTNTPEDEVKANAVPLGVYMASICIHL